MDVNEEITILLLVDLYDELKSAQKSFLTLWNELRDE